MCILRADIPRKSGFPLQGKEPGKNLNQSGLYHLVLAAGHSAAFIAGCHTRDVLTVCFASLNLAAATQEGCGSLSMAKSPGCQPLKFQAFLS